MKKWLLVFCVVLGKLAAEESIASGEEAALEESYWKFHKFATLGYRRDRQSFSEFEPANRALVRFQSSFRSRDTVQLAVGSHIEWRDFILSLVGAYGWLAHGRFDFFAPQNGVSLTGYNLGAGYTADARGSLGFRLKLYNCPSFGFSLIPTGGYQYSHVMNFVEGEKRSPGSAVGDFSFPNPNQQDWFGPFVEGKLEFRFWEKVIWTLFYQYHWPDLRSKSKIKLESYTFDPEGNLTDVLLSHFSSVIKGEGLRTQLGGTDLKLHHASGWTFGVHFEGSSTWSKTCRAHVKTDRERLLPAPIASTTERAVVKAKVHWVRYDAYLFAGYRF